MIPLCMIMILLCSAKVLADGQGFFVLPEPAASQSLPAEADGGEAKRQDLDLYAVSAALIDADSGRLLYEKNANTPMAMASTTKIMTCILVLENGDLDDMAFASAYAASMPKVKLYVRQGEQYQVRDLLYSLMLESHNDTAVVLAEYIGGKLLQGEAAQKNAGERTAEESRQAVKAFAALMNDKAQEIGCLQTWFITPNGLDATENFTLESGESVQREHSTTAAELARIMAYCIGESPQKEKFLEITRTQNHSFTANGRSFSCNNHNAFLQMMDGALSGKTGFTNKAGYCYVGALERDGRTFVVALLACGWPNNKTYKWSDTKKLMNYGLENYFYRDFLAEGTAYEESLLRPLPVENGKVEILGGTAMTDVTICGRDAGTDGQREETKRFRGMLMRPDEEVRVECRMEEKLQAPVKKGTIVGEICYSVDGRNYLTENIVTVNDVESIDLNWCVRQIWERFLVFR